MSDPAILPIPEWEWTLVASNVTSGFINRLTTTVYYYQTYRDTGGSAPSTPTVGTIPEEAVRIFEKSNQAIISASAEVDVYVMCANSDDDSSDAGLVRIDL